MGKPLNLNIITCQNCFEYSLKKKTENKFQWKCFDNSDGILSVKI